jgi:hypothetical protein
MVSFTWAGLAVAVPSSLFALSLEKNILGGFKILSHFNQFGLACDLWHAGRNCYLGQLEWDVGHARNFGHGPSVKASCSTNFFSLHSIHCLIWAQHQKRVIFWRSGEISKCDALRVTAELIERPAKHRVTWDSGQISAKITRPVTRDGRIDQNGTVIRNGPLQMYTTSGVCT